MTNRRRYVLLAILCGTGAIIAAQPGAELTASSEDRGWVAFAAIATCGIVVAVLVLPLGATPSPAVKADIGATTAKALSVR